GLRTLEKTLSKKTTGANSDLALTHIVIIRFPDLFGVGFFFLCTFILAAVIISSYCIVNTLALVTLKNIVKNIGYGKSLNTDAHYPYTCNNNQKSLVPFYIPPHKINSGQGNCCKNYCKGIFLNYQCC